MRIIHHNVSSILLAILLLLSTHSFAKKSEEVKSKVISKNYTVKADHLLEVDNKFGEVKITTWDKNEMQVKVTIEVKGMSENRAQKSLDAIQVDISESTDETSFTTKFGDKYEGKNVKYDNEFTVDYEIKMPKTNRLNLDHSFGAFVMNDLDGAASIKVSFGSANIGKLSSKSNELTFKFSSPIEIEHIEEGELTIKYSKLNLTSATQLKMESEFSSSKVVAIGKLDLEIKFGSFDIQELIQTEIESKMSSINVGTLHEKGIFDTKYGSLTLDEVTNKITLLDIDGEFSPIKVKIAEGASFAADLSTNMANLKVPSDKSWKEKVKEHNSESYKGSFGKNTENIVKIDSNFGSVKIDF